MGILSEMDMMNRDVEDDAFEVSSDSETVDSFSEEFEPVEPPKQEPQAEDAEEARKKAEFDAAEAKRKAEWEAKQAQKKLREQQELDRLAAMSDDDVMQASMNRVSQDTERLTRRNMKLCVMEDVQTECLADPAFARLVMNPKKKMVNCFHYINRKAREYLEQEMKDNDEKPVGGAFGGDVPDELCYQWAREYFRDADAKEDAEPEEKFVPKTYNGKVSKAGKGKKDKVSRGDIVGFLCKKGGLEAAEIGKIDVNDRYTYVAVSRAKMNQVLRQTQGEKIKGIKTVIEPVR